MSARACQPDRSWRRSWRRTTSWRRYRPWSLTSGTGKCVQMCAAITDMISASRSWICWTARTPSISSSVPCWWSRTWTRPKPQSPRDWSTSTERCESTVWPFHTAGTWLLPWLGHSWASQHTHCDYGPPGSAAELCSVQTGGHLLNVQILCSRICKQSHPSLDI